MLIARAPMRISFGGGGTDLEAYYGVHGGFVVSASIDKYFYVVVSPSESDPTQIFSANYQSIQHLPLTEASSVNGNLALAEAVLGCFSLHKGVNVFLASEVPPGTGLGSSGSVAVAMIKGLSALFGQSPSKQEVAELACRIEIEKLNMPVGKQDQYASSFGGLNTYTFSSHSIEVQPIIMSRGARRRLERNLMLFFTGSSRQTASILREQRQATQSDPRSSNPFTS